MFVVPKSNFGQIKNGAGFYISAPFVWSSGEDADNDLYFLYFFPFEIKIFRILNKQVYYMDVSHLVSRIVEYIVPADNKRNKPERCYRVTVIYSNHCYTKATESGERLFDERRYELSKKLPDIISNLLNLPCSFANGNNYYTVEFVDNSEQYEIYFEVYKLKATGTLHLMVHSAYVRDIERLKDRPKWKSVRFSTILYSALSGKKLHR